MLNYELDEAIELIAANPDVFPDSHGNISLHIPDLSTILIKPSGMQMRKGYLRGDQFVQVSTMAYPNLTVRSGAKPSVDLANHVEMYRAFPDVRSIVHTHATFSTVFSRLGRLPCLFTEQLDYFGGAVIAVDPGSFPSMNWGRSVVDRMRDKKGAVLLHAHGAITWGESPLQAVQLAVALEEAAKKVYYFGQVDGSKNATELKDIGWAERYNNEYGQR